MPVPTSKTLFRNVSILDSTGADPYPGDVLVENDRIVAVGAVEPGQAEGVQGDRRPRNRRTSWTP